ncbi:hypothetical protein AV530_006453 [Patagioenas fasciata monilis]|uniref:Uncharacterized protein n=1 Tax=Patagioenas fasciata monilis TaxID=372326 RepID=A0A1V4KGM8_PATFA|nr:hypothetical protein AV530_006453 [Patagioenas fasciata monilis]
MYWVYPTSYTGRPNIQLQGQKKIVQQHRQPSVDNQNVPTAEESLCCDGFVILRSDFTELEKKLDDTKKELEEVHADLVMVIQELDLARAEVFASLFSLTTF